MSKLAMFWVAYLLISPVFMRQVLNFILKFLGRNELAVIFWALFLLGGGVASFCLYKSRPSLRRIFLFSGVFAVGLFYASQVKVVEERMHLINFGLLGWLIVKDIGRLEKGVMGIGTALLCCIFVAALEETLQLWIPDRMATIQDVLLGVVGSFWGISLFFSSHEPDNPDLPPFIAPPAK